jgi:hypothetical protein
MGLQLSGSVQLEGNLLVTGSANSVFENISVTNRITANEINVQFVSSSIIYSSGSNRFGDEVGDKHQFTGSLVVSGTLAMGSSETGAGRISFNQSSNTLRIQSSKDGTDCTPIEFWSQRSGGTFTQSMSISGSNVGIGTNSPNANLDVQRVAGDSDDILRLGSDQNYYFGFSRNTSNGALQIQGNQTGYNNISLAPTSGSVGIGTNTPTTLLNLKSSTTTELRIESIGETYRSFIGFRTDGQKYDLGVNLNDTQDALSTNYEGTEAMRITSGRSVLFQKQAANNTDTGAGWFVNDYFCVTNNSADAGDRVFLINRQNSDGELIEFRQGNVAEGDITISGTTVSYNGGHLSRYSQTELNEKIEGLLKGTVMSNLDQMAEWINPETGEPYENEQLNCMKISDVEGDKNVAGVFVNWQYDSELLTNDMNIAMTGDMIIRIAEGVVVEKGDLLISAGDGTAKPQSDDLIRSNTIAKVISNHVTCVYEDGSYCVPCVLMAC